MHNLNVGILSSVQKLVSAGFCCNKTCTYEYNTKSSCTLVGKKPPCTLCYTMLIKYKNRYAFTNIQERTQTEVPFRT